MSYDDEEDDFVMGDIPSTLQIVFAADKAVRESASLCAVVEEPQEDLWIAAEDHSQEDEGIHDWVRSYEASERTFALA